MYFITFRTHPSSPPAPYTERSVNGKCHAHAGSFRMYGKRCERKWKCRQVAVFSVEKWVRRRCRCWKSQQKRILYSRLFLAHFVEFVFLSFSDLVFRGDRVCVCSCRISPVRTVCRVKKCPWVRLVSYEKILHISVMLLLGRQHAQTHRHRRQWHPFISLRLRLSICRIGMTVCLVQFPEWCANVFCASAFVPTYRTVSTSYNTLASIQQPLIVFRLTSSPGGVACSRMMNLNTRTVFIVKSFPVKFLLSVHLVLVELIPDFWVIGMCRWANQLAHVFSISINHLILIKIHRTENGTNSNWLWQLLTLWKWHEITCALTNDCVHCKWIQIVCLLPGHTTCHRTTYLLSLLLTDCVNAIRVIFWHEMKSEDEVNYPTTTN